MGHWWWGSPERLLLFLDEGRVLDSIVQATLVPLQQTSHFWALNYFISLIYCLTC